MCNEDILRQNPQISKTHSAPLFFCLILGVSQNRSIIQFFVFKLKQRHNLFFTKVVSKENKIDETKKIQNEIVTWKFLLLCMLK